MPESLVMTFSQFVKYVPDVLVGLYPPEECRAIAFRLLEDLCEYDRNFYVMHIDEEIPESSFSRLQKAVEDMSKSCPLQYVTGFEWFRGKRFAVEEGVLIPRPETEELVEWIKEDVSSLWGSRKSISGDNLTFFDAACGSGAIGIALTAEIHNSIVYACDFSEKAIEISAKNASALINQNSEERYKLFKCDLLNHGEAENLLPREGIDVLVSNPPYVCESEKRFMRPNVLFYEPFEALFVEDSNPLLFYERISAIGAYTLKPGGVLYFEINESFSDDVVKMLTDKGYVGAVTRKDFREKERMVRVFKI